MNDDLRPLLEQLISTVESIGTEVSDLLYDYSSRVGMAHVGDVRDKAEKLREAVSQLRATADNALHQMDR
jgi:hypothetical protein